MIHQNPCRIEGGMLRVDRKFLTGMRLYAEKMEMPLMAINPESTQLDANNMDMVEVDYKSLGFQVKTVNGTRTSRENTLLLKQQIAGSSLVYGSPYMGWTQVAKSSNIPYILALEYDLKTQFITSGLTPNNVLKRGVRSLRAAKRYFMADIPAMQGATALHCNGYPMFEESRFFNANRLET